MPSNLIPTSWRTETESSPGAVTLAAEAGPTSTAIPAALYTDCQSCRVTGTLTFSAVGIYALTVARSQAKTRMGKGSASIAGLGFLAVAAARWTAYNPPAPPPRAE